LVFPYKFRTALCFYWLEAPACGLLGGSLTSKLTILKPATSVEDFRKLKPDVPFIVDTDTDATEGQLSGPFDEAVLEGLNWDWEKGEKGWEGLNAQAEDEDAMIAIPFTSGTTAKPKGVVYTHRGAYLAALGNVIESGLNYNTGRCGYLWTLPMFHAMGWSKFPHP
jgi:acyl-CoA synthetase (AMP-forming)/AMP-acid ligase II